MAGGSVDPLDDKLEAIEEQKNIIRQDYSFRISNINGMKEAMERFAMDGTPIPQSIIDEREILKAQYRSTINSL